MRNPQVYRWQPVGLSDNRESTTTQPGDCRQLTNLIHDPTSKGVLAPRGAATKGIDFAAGGFAIAGGLGAISVFQVVNTRVYGLISTSRNAGKDEPFCYDLVSNLFVTVSGVTGATCPASPPTTGAWVPPSAALAGIVLAIAHSGFSATTSLFGWFDLSVPATPTWRAGNTTTQALPGIPVAMGTFFNRIWFSVPGGRVYFSDTLPAGPTITITNAGQVLVAGGSDNILAMAPQPMTTGIQGVLQSLLFFKANSIWQVTGDYSSTTSALQMNQLTDSVGCMAPRSIVPTPMGTLFMTNDGVRTASNTGNVSEPQPDVVVPFYNVQVPTRAAAGYAADIYRICLNTINNQGVIGSFDYWFALKFQKWTGPHTFLYDCVDSYGPQFLLSNMQSPGFIWFSVPFPRTSDTFVENGAQMAVALTTSLINPDPPMSEKAAIEMSMAFVPSPANYNVQVLSANGNLIAQTTLISAVAPIVWGGGGVWGGGALWAAGPYNVSISPLIFTIPLVFKTCVVALTGVSALYLRLGHFSFRYEKLGYTGSDA